MTDIFTRIYIPPGFWLWASALISALFFLAYIAANMEYDLYHFCHKNGWQKCVLGAGHSGRCRN